MENLVIRTEILFFLFSSYFFYFVLLSRQSDLRVASSVGWSVRLSVGLPEKAGKSLYGLYFPTHFDSESAQQPKPVGSKLATTETGDDTMTLMHDEDALLTRLVAL